MGIAAAVATRTRDEWGELAAGTDACLTPILTPADVNDHPHHRQRESFVMVGDERQPAPAPRFSRTIPNDPPRRRPTGPVAVTSWSTGV